MSTITTFDPARFARAVQERDAATQLSMYAENATVTIVDKVTQPGSPRILNSRAEIKEWLEDTYGRDMTHEVRQVVHGDRGAAFALSCRYPDGTNVMCVTVFETDGAGISLQTIAQVWDEK